MKARIPKPYQSLPKKQKEAVDGYALEIAKDFAKKQEEADFRLSFELYIKTACCTLYDVFGFDESMLIQFIGTHKRAFSYQNRLVMKGEQLEYLNRRMDEIFKKDGFPQEFIDSLLGEVEIIDAPEERGGQNG